MSHFDVNLATLLIIFSVHNREKKFKINGSLIYGLHEAKQPVISKVTQAGRQKVQFAAAYSVLSAAISFIYLLSFDASVSNFTPLNQT